MTPLERAARALASYRYEHGANCQGLDRNQWVDRFWREFEIEARAVLQAIRDIEIDTQDDVEIGMLIRGQAVLPEHDEPMQEDALNCWQAMIDAALEEGT